MSNKLLIGPPPHLLSGEKTKRIMLDVIIALLPALIASVVIFGRRAALVVVVCVAFTMLGEYLSRRLLGRDYTLDDLSAVVTGILLAFCLPVNIPFALAALGGLIAVVVGKQMFGGLGQNFVNPALLARIVLLVSFPVQMTDWRAETLPTSSATPLVGLKELMANPAAPVELPSPTEMLWGLHGGCLGEVCIIALLAGACYLLIRRVITPVIPLSYLGTVALLSWALGADPFYQLCSGGVVLGACFMATDYTTSPFTKTGKLIFGVCCGLLTVVIRLYGSMPEGVSFAIVIMNLFVPYINRLTVRKPYGGVAS